MEISSLDYVLVFAAFPMILVAYRFFWSRYAKPKVRSRLVLSSLLSLCMGITPALMVWQALVVGTVSCRRCAGGYFTDSHDPFSYWLTVLLLYTAAIMFSAGFLFSITLITRWSRHHH
ncbi:hypothetical protein VC218_21760 [Xanthomonas nasturtii]|uniref:hypothetical protein n=1 Tax=Xanthomonas nasturtii TaxID=1843581 RepID=UPI002B23413E|nr:hypothetical protein [Xanthomonas nasturtii]MEA9581417.1 hypothetical protein [Xanthomonas nasturtii]